MRMNRIAALTLGAGMLTMAACSDAPTAAPSAAAIPKTTSFELGTTEFALRAPLATELIVCKAGDVGGSFNLTIEAGEGGAGIPETRALPFTLNPGAAGVANCTLAATDNGDANLEDGDFFTVTETVDAGVTSSRVCYLNNGDLVADGCPDRFFINTAHGWTVVVTNVAPPPPEGCTYTKGWYRNKGKDTVTGAGGLVSIADEKKIFAATPGKPNDVTWNGGNDVLNLAQQLLAAIENGGETGPSSVQDAIDDAKAGLTITGTAITSTLSQSEVSSLISALSNFNEGGLAGFPHCGDEVL